MNILTSFVGDFLCTAFLFTLCLLITLGCKLIIIAVKTKFQKQQPPPQKEPQKPKTPKPKKKPSTVRSIEIDPEEIDRIYVRKIS